MWGERADAIPSVIHVAGRPSSRENSNLMGEYCRIVDYHGRPAYRKLGTTTVIRYWSPADRWLIDCEGLKESDVCNAYAEQRGMPHPADEEVVWFVWESQHRSHMRDPDFLVTSMPSEVQLVGRAQNAENSAMNGEYKLVGLHQGRPAYRKAGSRHALRYKTTGDRWLIDLEGFRDSDVCNGYADAQNSKHPGNGLQWNIWDSSRGRHVLDLSVQVIVAPTVVELLGRDSTKENASMNGSYVLAGMHAGRPAFTKADGSRHAIRYSSNMDRWLVDLEGIRDVDVCNGFAEAPAGLPPFPCKELEWQIWETSRGKHLVDQLVRTLVVPRTIVVSGREKHKENASLNGTYTLDRLVEGHPAYLKLGTPQVIRYWPSEDRWIIDLEQGFYGGDVANAYADARGANHPGFNVLRWHIWETACGKHAVDEDVIAEVADDEQHDVRSPSGKTTR
uniref:Uncharacterized protein n=1 Tax=Noctiluca scintillans TaxID=2966 RepID=A0A7S1AHZ9_NOCSC|mmetsp:Transcript_46344/g.123087  ORF Transcript_46344/g.123087 Transcript_46344/m.123087 type:complete len:448 (+) Transcript_46344:38-1381(+)|eukprot:CAMPEP_0194488440 /NCGR_PEP_ID=MMETSP0253-20130528/8362_1 /TAXON_ID=2966 /ORGANISM="Noctiluca scintillans" /LENGTH=447 /DNA_ID=CAMNT_0039328805 /DNA_START=35 /DNA_END=1378 /DNA_ORIENTATION=+